MTEFIVEENGDLGEVVEYLARRSKDNPVVLFTGDLGAGKTTLIKQIGTSLGLENQMNSPSFGIVNEYTSEDNNRFYHIDLYRLQSPEEAFDIGLAEILDSGSVCWIEWPNVLGEVWQSYDTVSVEFTVNEDGSRRIFVS